MHNPQRITPSAVELLTELVGLLRRGSEAVNSSECIEHPNGFRRICFGPVGDTSSMLHFWRRTQKVPDAHTHRWDFKSLIVEGELSVETFREVDSSSSDLLAFRYWHWINEAEAQPIAKWVPAGIANLLLEKKDPQVFVKGTVHEGRWSEIHRVQSVTTDAITFFKRTSPVDERTVVFSVTEKDLTEIESHELPRLSKSVIDELLAIVELRCGRLLG